MSSPFFGRKKPQLQAADDDREYKYLKQVSLADCRLAAEFGLPGSDDKEKVPTSKVCGGWLSVGGALLCADLRAVQLTVRSPVDTLFFGALEDEETLSWIHDIDATAMRLVERKVADVCFGRDNLQFHASCFVLWRSSRCSRPIHCPRAAPARASHGAADGGQPRQDGVPGAHCGTPRGQQVGGRLLWQGIACFGLPVSRVDAAAQMNLKQSDGSYATFYLVLLKPHLYVFEVR